MKTAQYPALALFVSGEWIDAGNRRGEPVFNPATGEALGELPHATAADLDRALAAAADNWRVWRNVSAFDRAAILRRAATLIRERLESSALALTLEQGKPVAQARTELQVSAELFEWYADEVRRSYGRLIPGRQAGTSLRVERESVGTVAAFTPWNFPASQVARKLAPALAAGCSCVLKPSEETPATALAIARALDDAGLPKGVLNVVFGVPSAVSAHLIAAPDVRKISFTGSTPVGKLIARQAAEGVKRVTLELGGHAPVIVFGDADVERTAKLAALAKLRNAGQVCTSPTRFLIHESIHDQFVDVMSRAMQGARIGEGTDPSTEVGPLANPRRTDAVARMIDDAREKGATLAAGGERIGNRGNFFAPTILADVPLEARAMNEEPFGPIALTRRFSEPEEALAEANRLPYGLAAYAFTRDPLCGAFVRREIECGLVGLNTFAVTWPETPFGGVKESGYGSEGGPEGLDAYTVTKFTSEAEA